MINKVKEKEIRIQTALGSLGEEYRNHLCRGQTPITSKGTRKCILCGLKRIHKGDKFYQVNMGLSGYLKPYIINICETCSWLPLQTINAIIDNHNNGLIK